MTITYSRYAGDSVEVSSAGDTRFSPMYAKMPDGRTIEEHYQCDVKGYNPGGTNWREWKGRYPKDKTKEQLWVGFYELWVEWALANPALMLELLEMAAQHNNHLTDKFARTEINQARALALILNTIE